MIRGSKVESRQLAALSETTRVIHIKACSMGTECHVKRARCLRLDLLGSVVSYFMYSIRYDICLAWKPFQRSSVKQLLSLTPSSILMN